MARGKRGVKFPGRANGEGRRPSFSDLSASEDPSQSAAKQLDNIQEVGTPYFLYTERKKHTPSVVPASLPLGPYHLPC